MPAVRRSPSRRHVRPAPDLRYHGAARRPARRARLRALCRRARREPARALACLHKLHWAAAQNYPGMRGLIVRKTRESLTQSALVTFEDKVLGPWWRERIAANCQRRVRQSYTYPNGSELVVGGLDKPSKVMSTEYDLAYVQEAIELTEGDWESLNSRVRNGVMRYQQLFGDTNPDAPTHWIKRRAEGGQLRLLESPPRGQPGLLGPRDERLDGEGPGVHRAARPADRAAVPPAQEAASGRAPRARSTTSSTGGSTSSRAAEAEGRARYHSRDRFWIRESVRVPSTRSITTAG
jgi:hypothetical protein